MHVLLCTDRQAQDRSFRQSRPHNPSLKHRNRQGNHWHTRHGKDEGQHGADPVHSLTRWPGPEPLVQHVTTPHRHNKSPEMAHTQQSTGPCGSGLISPGPWLTSRWAPEPGAEAWRVHQGPQKMGSWAMGSPCCAPPLPGPSCLSLPSPRARRWTAQALPGEEWCRQAMGRVPSVHLGSPMAFLACLHFSHPI